MAKVVRLRHDLVRESTIEVESAGLILANLRMFWAVSSSRWASTQALAALSASIRPIVPESINVFPDPVGATPSVLPCSSSARTLRSTNVFWRGRSSTGRAAYCAQAGRFGLAGWGGRLLRRGGRGCLRRGVGRRRGRRRLWRARGARGRVLWGSVGQRGAGTPLAAGLLVCLPILLVGRDGKADFIARLAVLILANVDFGQELDAVEHMEAVDAADRLRLRRGVLLRQAARRIEDAAHE